MALTIDATAGGTSANSFITLAEAETYMEGRGNKALWTAASDGDKNITLVEATREISVKCFLGVRADDTQALSWPRDWVINPDDPNNDYYDNTEIPVRVKDAQAELAFQYIKAGTTDVAAIDPATNVKRKQVDVLVTEYFSPGTQPLGIARYPMVLNWLRPLLENTGIATQVTRG